MALGAFLAGMMVALSPVSHQAAADALPMRDAFAVLFFVSVGMLFDPALRRPRAADDPGGVAIILIATPLAALAVVLAFGKPLRSALSIAVALAPCLFILAALAISLKIMPSEATNARGPMVISITLIRSSIPRLSRRSAGWNGGAGSRPPSPEQEEVLKLDESAHRVVMVGYGPIGRTLSRILRTNDIQVVVVEMNIETVRRLLLEGQPVVHGDASQQEILQRAGLESAEGLIITARGVEATEVIRSAREINPEIRILVRATYLAEQRRSSVLWALPRFSPAKGKSPSP